MDIRSNKPAREIRYNKLGKPKRRRHNAVRTVTKRKRQTVRFESVGTDEGFKYITSIPLTRDRNAKLPKALLKLVPEDIRRVEGGTPLLSVMMSKKRGVAILFCRAVRYSDEITRLPDGAVAAVRALPKPLEDF